MGDPWSNGQGWTDVKEKHGSWTVTQVFGSFYNYEWNFPPLYFLTGYWVF